MGSIYKITNRRNGKSYIGQTRHDAVKTRIRHHLRGKGSQPVKDAIEKYGQDAFAFEILHDGIIPEFLDTLEKEEIAKFNTIAPHGYNLTTGGEGSTHSEETKRKMSESRKGEKNQMYGKEHSEETKRKMSSRIKNPHKPKAHTHYLHLPPDLPSEEKWILFRDKFSQVVPSSTLRRWFYEWDPGDKRLMRSVAQKHRPPISEEHRQKLSKASTGRNYSVKTRQKLSKANKGRKMSAETRRKISVALKGKPHPNRSPDRIPAYAFFRSLPSEMSLREKRRLLREKFPNRNPSTIKSWVREWTQKPSP